jgi:hypothetical protein
MAYDDQPVGSSHMTMSVNPNTPNDQYRTFNSHGTLKIGVADLSEDIISPIGRVTTLKPDQESIAKEVILGHSP